jgi:hypothetical protein
MTKKSRDDANPLLSTRLDKYVGHGLIVRGRGLPERLVVKNSDPTFRFYRGPERPRRSVIVPCRSFVRGRPRETDRSFVSPPYPTYRPPRGRGVGIPSQFRVLGQVSRTGGVERCFFRSCHSDNNWYSTTIPTNSHGGSHNLGRFTLTVSLGFRS